MGAMLTSTMVDRVATPEWYDYDVTGQNLKDNAKDSVQSMHPVTPLELK